MRAADSFGSSFRDFSGRDHRRLLRRIIGAYDSPLVRGYCFARFIIINVNIIQMLSLCMRGKRRILELGCGFGLFGCYFAARNPQIQYHGLDLSRERIAMATEASRRLQLDNVHFAYGDARGELDLRPEYDAVLMMDLMHHLPNEAKRRVLDTVLPRLPGSGHLVLKEVARRPMWKLAFTWVLDVAMTQSFDMWYRSAEEFRSIVDDSFAMEVYPIADLLPYPHVIYLFSRNETGGMGADAGDGSGSASDELDSG